MVENAIPSALAASIWSAAPSSVGAACVMRASQARTSFSSFGSSRTANNE